MALSSLVAQLPGHDPAEFRSLVEESREWSPRPYVEAPPSIPAAAPAEAVGQQSDDGDRPLGERMSARFHRWEFQLRHGPRQALLRSLMRMR